MEAGELVRLINDSPSVLILGQEYLSQVPAYKKLLERAGRHAVAKVGEGLLPIWLGLGDERKRKQFKQDYQAWMAEVPDQPWLRETLQCGWNIVYTTAIDDAIREKTGENFGVWPIDSANDDFRHEFSNKKKLHCAWLYGNINNDEDLPPGDEREKRALKKRIDGKLRWLGEHFLRGYGTLVIDGWNPLTDSLDAEHLCAYLDELPLESVYLFGYQDDYGRDTPLGDLIESQIIIPRKESLYEYLKDYLAEPSGEDQEFESGVSISLEEDKGKTRPLSISWEDFGALENCMTLLDDRLESPPLINDYNRASKFAQFLSQSGKPVWSLFHDRANFCFKRECEKELLEQIRRQAKRVGNPQRLVFLAGPSNSGKTALLARIALKLKLERKYPVFFISGEPANPRFGEDLKKFIKKYFTDSSSKWKGRQKNVIIIWDNASAKNDKKMYRKLEQTLLECNPLVVGSCYSDVGSQNANTVNISANLQESEKKRLNDILRVIDEGYSEKFQAIVGKLSGKREGWQGRDNFFYILEKLFEYEFNQEYRDILFLLRKRLRQEVEIVEERTEENLDAYVKEFFEVNDTALEKGLASSWQIQLDKWLEANGRFLSETQAGNETGEREHLRDNIERINALLAVAGQFGVELPLATLLKFIQGKKEARDLFGREQLFIRQVIEEDTLVAWRADDNGENFVRFRHPFEAERYLDIHVLKRNLENPATYEVDLLKELIRQGRFSPVQYDQEEKLILDLVRQFGPNSQGSFSYRENADARKDPRKRYKEFWPEIADSLILYGKGDPEAMLIAAHFLRESEGADRQTLLKARTLLKEAQTMCGQNGPQRIRIDVELCSNLVAEQNEADAARSQEILNEVRKLLLDAARSYSPEERSAGERNRLLDIWLNCYNNYLRISLGDPPGVRYDELLAETLARIDDWLTITNDFDNFNLLGKINQVFKDAAKGEMANNLENRLHEAGNESWLYLKARSFWRNNDTGLEPGDGQQLVRDNLFYIPDVPERFNDFEITAEIREKLACAAQKTISLLEEEDNLKLARKGKRKRSLRLLLRSKWIALTGYLPFEEAQEITLSRRQWDELYGLACECDAIDSGYYLPALFIQAVYNWLFGDIKQAKVLFLELSKHFGWGWQTKRIMLYEIKDGGKVPVKYKIRTHSQGEKQLKAEIAGVVEEGAETSFIETIRNRHSIFIPPHMEEYLYPDLGDHKPGLRAKPAALHFNASGPLLGDPRPRS